MIFWGNAPFPRACLPLCNYDEHRSRKNAFPKSSLPTTTLPKSALPFSLLLPAVKLMMEIPSCTVPSLILHARRQQRSNTEAMAATNALLAS